MGRYILRRLLWAVPVLVGVSIIIFTLVRVIPGDVVLLILGTHAEDGALSPQRADIERLERELHLDQPLPTQYALWVWDLLRGDLGTSYFSGRPVLAEMLQAIPVSAELALLSLAISTLVAVPLGVLSAVHQDSWVDHAARLFSIGGLAIPSFWSATLVILIPLLLFGWIPPLGYVPLAQDPLKNLLIFLFPAAVEGLHVSAAPMRMTRAAMLDVLRQDYIRTAWSKGLRERAVVYRHGLTNALLPVITIMGNQLGRFLGGLVVMETIFALPGVGRLALEAINFRDLPLLQAIVLFYALVFTVMNLLVDLLYAWLDPRIRYA